MSLKFTSCNGLGAGPIQMIAAYLSSYFITSPLQWHLSKDRQAVYTYQGRNAIALLCQLLSIGTKDEVIAPAYNCGAEIDPFMKVGAKIILYRIDERLKIDVNDIKNKVTSSTRIIYITHFYGWPQDLDELTEWCKKKQIFLIEDCAQALFSFGPDNSMGRFGDAAIFSFVKTLPIPDGGALVINKNIWKEQVTFKSPKFSSVFRNSLPLLKKWFMNKNQSWQKYQLTRKMLIQSWRKNFGKKTNISRPKMLKSNYLVEQQVNWRMSRISKQSLDSTDINSVATKRRSNYQYLLNTLGNTPGFKPVYSDLPEKVCPLSFPFIVQDRHHWTSALHEKGILVLGWPGYYPGFNWDEYPEACNLKNNLLTLPVHQYLDLHHMEYIAQCVKEIADKLVVDQ